MNYSKIVLISLIFFINHSLNCEISEPYKSSVTLPKKLLGWFSPSNQKNLKIIIKEKKPSTIVELGAFLGLSAVFFARNMPENCKFYTIDTWTGTGCKNHPIDLSHLYNSYEGLLKNAYQQFLSNIKHEGLTEKITPIRMTTLDAADSLDLNPDLIYVDACHETECVYMDIKKWYPKLTMGGTICGDDWGWQSVRKGVIKAAQELKKTIHSEGNFWWFDPKN